MPPSPAPAVAPHTLHVPLVLHDHTVVRPAPAALAPGERARRMVNVVLAVAGLLVALPLMLLIALVVKATSPGPVIYTQTRVGRDRRDGPSPMWADRRRVDYGGRLFRIYKFRTMHADPAAAVQIWAQPGDRRTTPVGAFLRKYRLDELPQLWNVLRGDMNIVGPRPEQPNIFLSLREQIEDYPLRQRVLPGITGLAQVNQSYDRCVDDVRRKLRFDLAYIENASPWGDVAILLRTIPVILFRKGGW
jgi:lipopolysaccharide/colanic/teichoic acid biosynthesis glycosyltransferase